MSLSSADTVWNRAALESGGGSPGPGDRALASLLRLHGLVMNGGVHQALECVEENGVLAAADGYAFFGLDDVATFFRGASTNPLLLTWTDDTEEAANDKYAEMVPDDSYLVDRFEEVLRARSEQFTPIA